MPDAVICEPLRTPVGRFGGVFRDVAPETLAATVITELVQRTGIPGSRIDDVILGQASPNADAPAIGRVAALDAGLGIDVPGQQVDRLARGRVTAGGRHYPVPGGMIETAENLRAEYAISRADQDALAVQSHRRAVAAQRSGRFADEIVPVAVPQRKGSPVSITEDEHPRADTDLTGLAALRPIRVAIDPDSTVTAGNASGQNDGAALCVVTTPDAAAELGLRPLARLASWAVAGVAPKTMGLGPLGHPVGATGARILATLLREMQSRECRYGLETMCIGGGQGLAAIFERVA